MKKSILISAFASMALFVLPSCEKENDEEPIIEQTINVQLKQNESYTFTLPKNEKDHPYTFDLQASHYSVSKITHDASMNRTYSYTPELNYSGTDVVIVGTNENAVQICGNGQSNNQQNNCKEDDDADQYKVTINFTIIDNSTGTK